MYGDVTALRASGARLVAPSRGIRANGFVSAFMKCWAKVFSDYFRMVRTGGSSCMAEE